MIIVNFKLYPGGILDKAQDLALICEKVAKATGINIGVAVNILEAGKIAQLVKIPVWLQKVDAFKEGRHTGAVSPVLAQKLGVAGSLINHSECPEMLGTMASILGIVPSGFKTIVCCKSLGQAERILKRLKPTYLAYEPPELIASKEKSIATEKLSVLEKIVKMAKEKGVEVIAGAGIKSQADIKAVLSVGARGVILASEIVVSRSPEDRLMDLCKGFGV